ncbi:endo-1,4-beta-xylanase [Natronobiforma cellulositropha]|uniref:endo-1,4-beta-xylanase n=1 Tax=Natronobiforma cellulositropha TaxID=1679076 RepID=UPI0021D5DE23|nr:endo-1,4-beta-xylanase [Natronobiforma cellulositropha]
MNRRDYLRAIGATGVAGVVGSLASTTATAQSTLDEAAADERIHENQTGPLTVEVVDQDGTAISGASVDVEMQEHDFVFGTCVNAGALIDQYDDDEHPYRENILELFNTAVLENIHKWAVWEGNQSLADETVDWLAAHDFRIRGHTCIWGVDYTIPGDVQTAIDDGDAATIRERSLQHIEDIITHYGETVQEWDVVNEALHRGIIHDGVYPGQIDLDDLERGEVQPWRSPLLADWHAQAESVIDEHDLDVEICTNDYNTMTWSYARSRYAEQLEFLEGEGLRVDGIGLQAHIGPTIDSGEQWSFDVIDGVFEHYAQFDAAQRITEFDMAGDDWTGHEQRAEVFRQFLKTAYGHPNVDEFVMWGFWDNAHWLDEAPFFEEDWTEKPALDVYRDLVFDEWWTSESGTTDASGTYTVDAFLGDHEVTVTTDEESVTQTVSVTDSSAGQELTVTVAGGETTPTDATAVNAGGEGHESADGVTYVADEGYSTGSTYATSDPITGTDDDILYQSERYGEAFSYEFDLEPGTYDVQLHFAEIFHEADGERVFDVLVDGATAISDLDIHAEVGHDTALVRTVEDVSVADEPLAVSFDAVVDNAKVSAITIVPASTDEESERIELNGYHSQDTTGDGLYNDITGDGRTSFQDVVTFFEHLESETVQSNVEAFDFTGDGQVGFADLIALFEQI